MHLLDANVFIEAQRHYYAMDLARGFWDWLEAEVSLPDVRSIRPVFDEMKDYGDLLSGWIRSIGHQLFLDLEADMLIHLPEIGEWVEGHPAKRAKKNLFLAGADPFLISACWARGWTLVTQETSAGNKGDLKIPDACRAFGVSYTNTFELMRARSVRLVLPTDGLPAGKT